MSRGTSTATQEICPWLPSWPSYAPNRPWPFRSWVRQATSWRALLPHHVAQVFKPVGFQQRSMVLRDHADPSKLAIAFTHSKTRVNVYPSMTIVTSFPQKALCSGLREEERTSSKRWGNTSVRTGLEIQTDLACGIENRLNPPKGFYIHFLGGVRDYELLTCTGLSAGLPKRWPLGYYF